MQLCVKNAVRNVEKLNCMRNRHRILSLVRAVFGGDGARARRREEAETGSKNTSRKKLGVAVAVQLGDLRR